MAYKNLLDFENPHIPLKVLTGNLIGKQTIEKISEILKEYNDYGVKNVEIDLRGFSLQKDSLIELAYLTYLYECRIIGLGEKQKKLEALLHTGYFLKEEMGTEQFVKHFKETIEISDFPLMLKDNSLLDDELMPINVIQPIGFSNKYFHYNVIKPYLLEPKDLEQAIINGESIFIREKCYLSDIGDLDYGFRFANSVKERTILDIYINIISGRLSISE